MSEDIKLVRAMHGSARADGSAAIGRISFRLSSAPERRWQELFELSKTSDFSTEERGADVMLHIECAPGEVASKRDAAVALISDVNARWRSEVTQQHALARERQEQKRRVEDELNQELEALHFDRS
jgi:hypothetical protein